MGHVDLRTKHQTDLAEHMARVNQHVAKAKAQARPWRAIIALILAAAAGVTASWAGDRFKYWTGNGNYTPKLITAISIAAFVLFASAATVGMAGKARDVLTPTVGTAHAAIVRYTILLVGGATTLVLTVSLLKVPIGQLLVGGAVTTILLGIAGQQALANIFAGLMLLLSRPFAVGDYVRLKSGALGGVTEGQITEVGITYTRLETEDGTLNMPNSQVLASAVGPIPRSQPAEAQPPTSEKSQVGGSPAGPAPSAGTPDEPASTDPAAGDPARTGYDDPPHGMLPGGAAPP
jgi:small-conductance mechanosensitive channel